MIGIVLAAKEVPSGGILSLTSILVVFSSLTILWGLFTLLFQQRSKKTARKKPAKKSGGKSSDEIAAAIALALNMEDKGETYAAIATALHLYLNDCAHDKESYIITIKHNPASAWNVKGQNFRKRD